MSPAGLSLALADGGAIPVLGFGTWLIPDGEPARSAVAAALEADYRHLDTAQAYGNEASVGRALRESGVPRSDVFLTSKFSPGPRNAAEEAKRSLERLGVERLDLYLVHTPRGGAVRHWAEMEAALEAGLTTSIGISNFDAAEVASVCDAAEVSPAVNQIQFNPFANRVALRDACERRGVTVVAYSPLTHGRDLDDPVVTGIAGRLGRTPAQVLLRWGVQQGLVVLPKSTSPARIAENADVFDFTLPERDMASLDGLDRTDGTDRAVEERWWTPAARARSALATVGRTLRR